MEPIIIVGSGLAGYSLVRNLRRLDKSVPITLVTSDNGVFYSKPMLSEALTLNKSPDALVTGTAEQMATRLSVDVLAHTTVSRIHRHSNEISVLDGNQPRATNLQYSNLILASGAEPIRPDVAGDGADGMMTINSLDDYVEFRGAMCRRRRILILGAGLIGCEFANDLVLAGHEVDVVDSAPQPIGRFLPVEVGEYFSRCLADVGVKWHMNTTVRTLSQAGGGYLARLANGTQLSADIVLCAAGLKPRTALAAQAGLQTGRGIVVDRYLRTDDPNIYALGDGAEVQGSVLPFVLPIVHGAKALASTLAGTPTQVVYPAMPIVVKTPSCPTIVAPPFSTQTGRWSVEQNDDGIKSLYFDEEGRLQGFVLNGASTQEQRTLCGLLPAWLDGS